MCSFCHDVTRDQSGQTLDETPSFVKIASKPYQSPEAVAELIIFPHPDMPKVSFTATDLRDIIAYIMSLKRRTDFGAAKKICLFPILEPDE